MWMNEPLLSNGRGFKELMSKLNKQRLNREEIVSRITNIENIADDYEVAHSMEDTLMEQFIHDIADGCYTYLEIRDFAKLIKHVADIDFARHCA